MRNCLDLCAAGMSLGKFAVAERANLRIWMSPMGTAAQFDAWIKRKVEPLFADPAAHARWYAEKRVDFIDSKIERLEAALEKLRAERLIAVQEREALNTGEAEPNIENGCLDGYAKALEQDFQSDNRHELEGEKQLLEAIIVRTGFAKHGWRVGDVKVNDWVEQIILTRCRVTPRPRNSKKALLTALHQSVEAHRNARESGKQPDECKEAAFAVFRDLTSDSGTYGMIETMPILAALNAANLARDEAEAANLPADECRKRANDAFDAVFATIDTGNLATGPPN